MQNRNQSSNDVIFEDENFYDEIDNQQIKKCNQKKSSYQGVEIHLQNMSNGECQSEWKFHNYLSLIFILGKGSKTIPQKHIQEDDVYQNLQDKKKNKPPPPLPQQNDDIYENYGEEDIYQNYH